jgi:hypothetical protein
MVLTGLAQIPFLVLSWKALAPPGKYTIRVDNLGDPECQFKIRNLTTARGPVQVIDSKTFEIVNESQ